MELRDRTREGCLDPSELADYVHGALSPREAAALERHVASCAACRTLLSLVARSDSHAPLAWAASVSSLGSLPAPPGTTPVALVEGTRVGRYVLRERLGAGAMGVVFTAHDPELEREIAVKLLRSEVDPDAPRLPLTAQLLREAQAMAQLAHPNVVAVHDVGWFGDHIFIAMELVQGQTLAQWLAAAPRSIAEVLAMFIAAGSGLAAAHAAGLVHRDFKPENVLVGRDGRVRVTDFGLADRAAPPGALAAGQERGRAAVLAGTPFYMAPEQLSGEPVDARTDQFGFCVAIYAALTGKHPLRRAGARGDRPPRDRLPAWLWRTLRRGLALDRAQRYPSMDELLARLSRGRRRGIQIGAAIAVVVGCGCALVAARFGDLAPAGDRGEAAADSGPRCRGAERLLAGIWDVPRAGAIERAFRARGRPDAGATFTTTSLLLDQYANQWIAMRTDACERARRIGRSPDPAAELRIDCLDARRSELRELIDRLAAADDGLVEGAVVAVRALGPLGVCADDEALLLPARRDVAPRRAEVAAVDGSGRVSYFTTDTDGGLWQVQPRDDGGAADRSRIDDGAVASPVVVVDDDRRLEVVFRRVESTLWHAWREPGGAWRTELIASGVTDDPAVVVVAHRLVAFARRNDGWLWRYWQAAPGEWTAMRITDAVAGTPAAASDIAGELYSFVRKADGSLWLARHPGPGAPPDRPVKLLEPIAGDPVAVRDAIDKLTYYVRQPDGSLVTGYQHDAGNPVWHHVVLTRSAAGVPALAFDPDGRQVCLSRTPGGTLWAAIQDGAGVGPWHDIILDEAVAADPSLVLRGDGRLAYFVRAPDGRLVEGRQDAPRAFAWHRHIVEAAIASPATR
ncbi:MAG TPA: protein kinase [Kofleriaceae bacterium]|jgi:hypothetical protein|nr:protein kinase [Kofleriaceae bacterium]